MIQSYYRDKIWYLLKEHLSIYIILLHFLTIFLFYDILNYEDTQEKITPSEYLTAYSYEDENHINIKALSSQG